MTHHPTHLLPIAGLLAVWLLAAGLLPASAAVTTSYRQFVYQHLGQSEGLQSSRVYSLVETSDGAMWISNKNGIDRYNGTTMTNYQLPLHELLSDGGGRTTGLAYSKKGTLWAYDNKGHVFRYCRSHNRFELVLNMMDKLSGDVILNHLCVDIDGQLLLSLNSGLYVVPVPPEEQAVTKAMEGGHYLLPKQYVNRVVAVGRGLAICTNDGVFEYNRQSHAMRHVVRGVMAISLFEDPHTRLTWVGTFAHGVSAYHTGSWRQAALPSLSTVPSVPVRAIVAYEKNTILIGVDGAGVYAVSSDGRQANLLFNADDQAGARLHGNGIYAITCDRLGNIWMGSYSGGVDMAIPTGGVWQTVQHEYLNQQSLVNNNVNAVLQTRDGRQWYATDRGVSIFNPATRQWTHTLYNKVAQTLTEQPSGRVLVGTYGQGVYALSASGAASPAYSTALGNLLTDYVYSLYTDRDGDLWIGCLDGDMKHVKASGGEETYPIRLVQCITSAPDGRIAVGTPTGLHLISKATRATAHYFTPEEASGTDVNCYVQSALFKSATEVWLATDGGGLYLYDLKHRRKRHFSTADGLPSNTTYALAYDGKRRLWVSTDHGLAMITQANGYQISNMNYLDGMSREYKRMSVATMANGNLLFGSTSGAVMLSPTHVGNMNYAAPLHIQSVDMTSGKADPDGSLYARVQQMLADGRVTLAHNHNTLTISFESINYKYQHDIAYSYMLEGYDAGWSKPSNQQQVQYTNLPAGDYVFRVRSVSLGSGKVVGNTSFALCIRQPWWNTWWAWCLWIAIVAAMAYGLWHIYLGRLKQRHFNDKINFFVHTAHNIRTPLSLVLAPLSDLAADASLSESSRRYLTMARRNGEKLYDMISQLLDFERHDAGATQPMHVVALGLQELLQRQVDYFLPLARQKGVTLQFDGCPARLEVWMDAGMADKILDNLLSNAVKYTPAGGTVTLAAHSHHNHALITIHDTGIGIPKADQKAIFTNFFRARNAVNSQQPGSGLGLMLTKRLVEQHGGSLSFVSEEGKGATFTIGLRLGNSHLSKHLDSQLLPAGEPEGTTRPTETPATAPATQPSEGDESKDVMLFVDDNDELRTYISMAFADTYNVVAVPSGEAAIDYLSRDVADIVVSDVMMPGMAGDELCQHIKETTELSWLPVILLTAKQGRDFMLDGLQKGADDYIVKPFDPAILRGKVASLLANRRRLSHYYMSKVQAMVMEEAAAEPATASPSGADTPVNAEPSPGADDPMADAADQEFVHRATQLVLDNLADTSFTIDQLCREMAMSRTLFYGRLKQLTGSGPQDFIRTIRLERASLLLRQGHNVTDVSALTGFANVKYFSTVFKKHFGVSPSKF